jgi:hypothetical protein
MFIWKKEFKMLIVSKSRDIIRSTLCTGFLSPAECQFIIENPNPALEKIAEKFRYIVDYVNSNVYKFVITNIGDFETIKLSPTSPENDWKIDLDENSSLKKLSLLVFLSPVNSYHGGKLGFAPEFEPTEQEQGNLVIYPPYLNYRFEPIKEGELTVLKCWAFGPPFR